MAFRRERLRVETSRHVIEGVLQLPTEGYRSRTTDYLNAHESDFVALTEATVAPLDGGDVTQHEFVAVNLRHAVLVVELEFLGVTSEPVPVIAALAPASPAAPEAAVEPSSTPPPSAA
jgi:hypothetical protein